MTVAGKAARGAAWMIATTLVARAIGLAGTLIVTRFLAPDEIGEVAAASVITMTAGWLTIWGFGQYAVVEGRGDASREVTWHAFVAYVVLGVVGLGAVTVLAGPCARFVDAPGAAGYVAGFAVAAMIRRIGAIPERVLARELRFREVALAAAAGELAHVAVTLVLAAAGWGGAAIVAGNIAHAVVFVGLVIRAAGFRSWATPTPLSRDRFRRMLRFGLPLGVQSVAHNGGRYWGALVVTRIFGPAATGLYNLAYNVADLPAIYIGEQLALVLLPSMASLPPERRAAALERSTALLSLVIFPLAIGLGVVAAPLIAAVLPPAWQGVAPLLAVLSALSVFRPITWVLSAYMEARSRTNRIMYLELANLAALLGGIYLLSPYGLVWSASAVGVSYGLYAIAGVWLVARDGPSVTRLALGFLQPLAACGVMAGAVLILRPAIVSAGVPAAAQLAIEIAVGGAVYVAAALALCRATARDLIAIVRDILRSRSRAADGGDRARDPDAVERGGDDAAGVARALPGGVDAGDAG